MTTEYLLKQYEASLRVSGSHEAADQIRAVVSQLTAAHKIVELVSDSSYGQYFEAELEAFYEAGKGDV